MSDSNNSPAIDPYDFTTWPKYAATMERIRTHIERAGFEEVIHPLYDQVVIRRFPDEDVTAGGIALPGSGEKQNRGVVLAVGPGKENPDHTITPLTVQPGDVVIFGHFSGINAVKINGENVVVLRENEITGRFCREKIKK